MPQKNIVVKTEQQEVTEALLMDYLSTLTDQLTDAQRKQFLAVCSAFNLNPWKREVYAVTYKSNGVPKMSIVTGYEVYLKRAEMNPNYDGFECNIHGEFARNDQGIFPKGEAYAECKVYRKDRRMPVQEVVYFDEFAQLTKMWKEKPRLMLRKIAIANAFRKAFPLDFGGMPYTNDELPDNMTTPQEVHCEVVPDNQPAQVQAIPQEVPVVSSEQPAKNIKPKSPKKTFADCISDLRVKYDDTLVFRDTCMVFGVSTTLDIKDRDTQQKFYKEYSIALKNYYEKQQPPETARNDYEQTEMVMNP